MLEVLNGPFVFLRRSARCERPQVLPLAGLLIGMAAVDAKFTGFEFRITSVEMPCNPLSDETIT
jgi:hypothetical protein